MAKYFIWTRKKRALLKGTDLSITLFCRHGAFIAFLSTSPFPFLKHSHSPAPVPSILPGALVVSVFPQTPALLPSSLQLLGLLAGPEIIPWSSSRAGRCWEGAQDRSLGDGFPLRDFMALVLLEHLFYGESGCSSVEQGIQCLS